MLPKRSLQGQWLIAFLGTTCVVVSGLTLVAWNIADRQVRQQVEQRLSNIGRVVSAPAYPMNSTVLRSISELTSAELVLVDSEGKWVLSTIENSGLSPARTPVSELQSNDKLMRFDHAFAGPTAEMYHAGWIKFEPTENFSDARPSWIGILIPHSLSRQMLRQALALPLITGLATAVGLSAIAAWLTHRIVQRLRAMQSKVQLIAAGDYTPISLPSTQDELHALTENINRMAKELEGLEASIQSNERDRLVHSLAAGLSHDLRNTLTGARLAIQLHAKGCHQDDESIDVAIRQMRLAEEQLARWMRLGDDSTKSTPMAFGSIAENAIELIRPMMDHLGSQLSVQRTPESDRIVLQESELIGSAILNLLLNAVQAAGKSGRIDLLSRIDGNILHVDVTDSGSGPAPEIQSRMFDPLVTSKQEGVGLGLALVAKTAKLLNGSIEWSRRDNRTQFSLSIPLSNDEFTAT